MVVRNFETQRSATNRAAGFVNHSRAAVQTRCPIWVPLSLAPGFSRVYAKVNQRNRFSGFPLAATFEGDSGKPLKRLLDFTCANTRLKPGANERGKPRSVTSQIRFAQRSGRTCL